MKHRFYVPPRPAEKLLAWGVDNTAKSRVENTAFYGVLGSESANGRRFSKAFGREGLLPKLECKIECFDPAGMRRMGVLVESGIDDSPKKSDRASF